MANTKKNPTENAKEKAPKAQDTVTDKTIEQLTAIFNNQNTRDIRTILETGHAILQERMAVALEKVLSVHLEAFGENSFTSRGTNPHVPTIILTAKGIAWEDATTFLNESAPILMDGGVRVEVHLGDMDKESIEDITKPVVLDVHMILTPEDLPLLHFLDEDPLITADALEYLQTTLAKRESETT